MFKNVFIRSYARLHLGLIQLSNISTRINGGFGFYLNDPFWELDISDDGQNKIINIPSKMELEYRKSFEDLIGVFSEYFGKKVNINVFVKKYIPGHVGLGSKTSFLVGLLCGLCKFYNIENWSIYRNLTKRGSTSGLGINLCLTGGFIIDSGHYEPKEKRFAPSSSYIRDDFPKVIHHSYYDSNLAILIPKGKRINASEEVEFFNRNCPVDTGETRELLELIYLDLVPSILEDRKNVFIETLNKTQDFGFKKREVEIQSDINRNLIRELKNKSYGVCLSSFGPSIAVFPVMNDLEEFSCEMNNFSKKYGTQLILSSVRNNGVYCAET